MRVPRPPYAGLIYWLVWMAAVVMLGLAAPFLVFLGSWQLAPVVLLATWLQPRVFARLRR